MNLTRAGVVALLLSTVVGAQQPPAAGRIRHVATRSFTLVVKADGSVVGWGGDADGQAARPPSSTRQITAPVGIDLPGKALQVALGADGTVWAWGTNSSAQMGNGEGPMSPDDPGGRNLVPVPVEGVTGAKRLSIGGGHVAALLGDGTLRLWGHDGWGQIGVGTSGFYQEKPMRVTGLADVAAVYLGGAHSLAVRADGTLWIWGKSFIENGPGLLGKNLHVPTRLDLNPPVTFPPHATTCDHDPLIDDPVHLVGRAALAGLPRR